jgi:hypothetical protein
MGEYLSDLVDQLRHSEEYNSDLDLNEDAPDPKLYVRANGMVVEVESINIRWNEIIFKARGN